MTEEVRSIEEPDRGFKGWWQRNRRTVFFVGGLLISAGCGYAIYRNWDVIKKPFISSSKESLVISNRQMSVDVVKPTVEVFVENLGTVPKIINGGEVFDVSSHLRNLSNGRKASIGKIAEAAERGISLLENQTLVDSYIKNAM